MNGPDSTPPPPHWTIACPDCGTIQSLPALLPRARLLCRRCDKVLERTTGRSIDAALALAIATFVLWFPANLSTLLTLHLVGIDRSSRLGSGVIGLFNEGLWLVAIVVGLQGIILPFVRFGLLASALAGIKLQRQGLWTGIVFRWAQHLDLWSMPDVFLLGGIIGYSRIAAVLPVTIGPGGWCFVAAAFLTMLTRATLDDRSVWRMIRAPDYTEHGHHIACTECALVLTESMVGRRCPRCAAWLHRRKPYSIMRCSALIIASYPLYLVAIYFPMNVTTVLGHPSDQTIMYGVNRLVQAGFLPLAVIIFCASIVIPVGKLVVMSWLLWSVHCCHGSSLRPKTRAYRFVEEIGRWSNIDIFTIVIFLPLMQVEGLVGVRMGTGGPAFLAVIVLAMFAAKLFDPRLLWDLAHERAGSPHLAWRLRPVGSRI
jgi:paraquat-inducible protein A